MRAVRFGKNARPSVLSWDMHLGYKTNQSHFKTN
jgi:hypothetical protein